MKKLIFLSGIIIFMSRSSIAQDSSFVINGKLEKIKSGIIYLNIYENAKTIKDSTRIKNGIFKFTGYVSSPHFATLTLPERKNDFYTFYIEPTTLSISGRANSLKLLNTKGSPLNDDDKILKGRMQTISLWEEANSKLYEQAYKDKNKKVIDSLDEVDNEILIAKRRVVADFVKDYPASMRAAMAITENFGYYAEASDVEPLYNELDTKIKNSPKGQEIKKIVEVYSAVAIGKTAPDIIQFNADSNRVSLSSLKGKYVLIDFWASWCGPCRRENPNIVAAYNQFRNKGFTVFGVSYDIKKDRWLKAIADDHLDWYQVSTLEGWDNPTSAMYGIKAIPSNVLIDKDGIIIAKNIFGEKLVKKLSEIMN